MLYLPSPGGHRQLTTLRSAQILLILVFKTLLEELKVGGGSSWHRQPTAQGSPGPQPARARASSPETNGHVPIQFNAH